MFVSNAAPGNVIISCLAFVSYDNKNNLDPTPVCIWHGIHPSIPEKLRPRDTHVITISILTATTEIEEVLVY